MISYVETADEISAADLQGFFDGWRSPPSPADHVRILRGSDHVVLARDGSRVVGFVTALSDGVLCAYISMLEVLPEYRRRGIGSELTRRMLSRLAHLYAIDLLCDTRLQSFYARAGLRPSSGMLRRNFAWTPPNLT